MASVNSLIFDILARDRASSTLNKVGAASTKTSTQFEKLRTAAARLAVGAALVKFGKDSVRAFKESEDAQLRLEDAFRRFPALADSNIQSFQKLNQQLQLKTRFDDEAYASGQAILAQFKLTGKQIEQVTPLLGDYAAKVGIDVPQAATLLGKAFLGNTRALKTLGISYKTTGNQALDTAKIIDLVRQKVGGFAEQEGKTAAGQVAILGNKFQELQEKVGAKLLPAMLGLATAASKVLDVFGGLTPETQQMALAMTALGIAALLVGPRIATMATAMKEFGLQARSAALGMASFGVALLVIPSLTRIFEEATAKSQSFWDRLKGINKQIIDTLDPTDKLSTMLGLTSAKTKDTADATKALGTASDQYRAILGPLVPEVANLATETENAYQAQQLLNGVMLDATQTDIAVRDAVASWAQKVREATKAGDKNTHSLSLNNQAGRDNISALTDMATKVNTHAQAVFDQTGSVAKANKVIREDRDRLLDAAEAAGFNRGEIAKLIAKYLKIPTKKATNIVQPGMRRAIDDTLVLKGYIDGLRSKTITVSVNTNFVGGRGGGRAFLGRQHGGPVDFNRPYLVGEQHPEVLYRGRVYPGGQTPPPLTPALPTANGGPVDLTPKTMQMLGKIMGQEAAQLILSALGAANVRSARTADLYGRAG